MARSRHAMRVHPLRSKTVVVGVPVAAAVAFGAHSVLGITPLSAHHDTEASSGTAGPDASVQSYGLATAPPPTTLGLLAGPTAVPAPSPLPSGATGSAASADPGAAASADSVEPSSTGATTTSDGPSSTAESEQPTEALPIPRQASSVGPSMMTFTPASTSESAGETRQEADTSAPRAAERAAPAADGQATSQSAPSSARQDAPQSAQSDGQSGQPSAGRPSGEQSEPQAATPGTGTKTEDASGERSSGSGGSLLGVDLGAAKVSVLSFGG